jgi:hypothetical protein
MFKQNLAWLLLSVITVSIVNPGVSFGSDNDSSAPVNPTKPLADAATTQTSGTVDVAPPDSTTKQADSVPVTSEPKTVDSAPIIDSNAGIPPVKAVTSEPTKPETKVTALPKVQPKTTKLFGRIEQIADGPGAQFPVVLKAMTAKMDTSNRKPITGSASDSLYSGSLVNSFPTDYRGNWGGSLTVWQAQFDPICWQIDPEEVNRTRALIKPGAVGDVTFQFRNDAGNRLDLEPAQVVFMVPMKDTRYQETLGQMLGSGGQGGGMTLPGMNSGQMGAMMQQMMANMNVPIMLNFGEVTGAMGEEGLSGNAFHSKVLKNSIRELSPSVLEQQIVTSEVQQNKKTGQTRNEYSETVIRFTKQSATQLYVQAASVNYTADKRFERKIILYGTVNHGTVARNNANPLSGSGFGNLFSQPGGMQVPNLPGGVDMNQLQKLLNPGQ